MIVDVDRMKSLLEAKRLELRKSLVTTPPFTGQPEAVNYLPEDEEESAIAVNEAEEGWLVRLNEEKLLDEVEEALKLIEQGTYGLCIQCKQPIPPARLTAIPWAARDVTCQERQEEREVQESFFPPYTDSSSDK